MLSRLYRGDPATQEITRLEFKEDDIPSLRFMKGEHFVLQVDEYPEDYAAFWLSNNTISELTELLDTVGVPHDSQTLYYLPAIQQHKTKKYKEVKEISKQLDKECSFLRVDTKDYAVTWEYDDQIHRNIIGFLSRKGNFGVLDTLFFKTVSALLLLTDKEGNEVKMIAERYG